MKRKLLLLVVLFTFCGILITPSCKTTDPTFGTLTITVYDPLTGQVVPNLQINLASSFEALKAGTFLRSAWTNDKGKVYFGELTPLFYWYGADGYDDYGAIQIYAGNDFYVHFFPNTVHQGGK